MTGLRRKLQDGNEGAGMTEEFAITHVESPTGASLAVRIKEPEGQARAIVMIHHGLAEHAGRYARFARFLSQRGFIACAHDHRGHGQTTAPDAPRGVFAGDHGWDKVMQDAIFLRGYLTERYGNLPVIVFGHSMGGVVAMNHAQQEYERLAGVAVWNSNLVLGGMTGLMRAVLWLEGLFKPQAATATWLNALTFSQFGKTVKDARTPSDWLSRIPEEVDAYIADPDSGWRASISLWKDLVTGFERAESSDRIERMRRDLPLHLAGGGQDPATDKAKAMRTLASRLKADRFTDITLRINPQARHETLNDLGYEQAMEDFAEWAERVVAQATAGEAPSK
ncbi:alpha/beta hydrolase [Marinicauda pacifica]|uniref:Alpha/beta hydrolase n=2 Tax=Marinicauda pacifica TaxID=1133559 RepID=A0A4S2HB51_9PROT|nr:alpha/beta hydrolase [Marinicauda pacifica]